MDELKKLELETKKSADKEKARLLQRFFKTGEGEYGEGDIFLGIPVPILRKIVNGFKSLRIEDVQKLLNSEVHEKRMIALFVLIEQYKKAKKDKDEKRRKEIFDFYLKNTGRINNWDLVDLSAPNIVGDYLLDRKRGILHKLSQSNNLWERRISVLATFAFIREGDFGDTLRIAETLLNDKHDLIQKAVGWMLRELGKRNLEVEEEFLRNHYKSMPRTMLRYSIERFDEEKRKKFLDGNM